LQQCIVAYDETQKPSLKKALLLGDAISDLPEASVFFCKVHTFFNVHAILLFYAGRESSA
jgi:hypothetical protein